MCKRQKNKHDFLELKRERKNVNPAQSFILGCSNFEVNIISPGLYKPFFNVISVGFENFLEITKNWCASISRILLIVKMRPVVILM